MEPDLTLFDGPLPLFPLPNAVLLPHTVLPLHVFEPRYVRMVRDAVRGRGLIGMVKLLPGWETDYYGDPAIRRIGCAGRIHDLVELPEGRFDLKLFGIRKFEVLEEVRRDPYRAARLRWIEDRNENARGAAADAAVERLATLLAESSPDRSEPTPPPGAEGLPFAALVNTLAVAARPDPDDMQMLLELRDVYARARRVERILRKRIDSRRRAERYRAFLPEDPGRN